MLLPRHAEHSQSEHRRSRQPSFAGVLKAIGSATVFPVPQFADGGHVLESELASWHRQIASPIDRRQAGLALGLASLDLRPEISCNGVAGGSRGKRRLQVGAKNSGWLPPMPYSFPKYSITSGSVQSTGPMNLRRTTPPRSITYVSGNLNVPYSALLFPSPSRTDNNFTL